MNHKNKGTAYIHIGLEKTGTTSLQEFFHINRELLKENHKVYFPKTPGLKNHTDLPLYAYTEKLGDLPLRKGLTDEMKLEAFRGKFKTTFLKEIKPYAESGYDILISNEHLSSRGGLDKEGIAKLIALFKEVNLSYKVIVYLRRQDQFLLSTYSTRIKSGGTDEFNKRAFRRKRYDYLSLLNTWKEVVGLENMKVGIFERSRWKEQSLYLDFLNKIGIEQLGDLTIPPKDANKSLDRDQIAFLVQFNQLVPEFVEDKPNELRGEVISILEKKSTGDRHAFYKNFIIKIKEHFEEDNKAIVDTYLEDKSRPLFTFKELDNAEAKNTTLTVEKAIEIGAQLWAEQQKTINELKNQQSFSTSFIKDLQEKIEEKKRLIQKIIRGEQV